MSLTFKEFREIVAPYAGRAGKCATADPVATFSRAVMEYLLYSGASPAIRKFVFTAHKGCFSLPPEIEIPLKARIDAHNATIWNKWFSFHSTSRDTDKCIAANQVIIEDGTWSPLAYPLQEGGEHVGAMGTCEEAEGAAVIIQGKDTTGREVYTVHKGEHVCGEKLTIHKNKVKFSAVKFGEITAVLKPKTNGYVNLWAVNHRSYQTERLLADWSPSEEKPLYRVMQVINKNCPTVALVTVIARVRLKDSYSDNEITLFDNSLAIMLAAQRIQSEINNDTQTANYKRQATEDLLEKEAGYKKISGSPLDVFVPLSGGAIKNIV